MDKVWMYQMPSRAQKYSTGSNNAHLKCQSGNYFLGSFWHYETMCRHTDNTESPSILSCPHTMKMKGFINSGTLFILSHQPNNTVKYSLNASLPLVKWINMRGLGLLSGWIESVWGATGHRGLISWTKHSGCWLPPVCSWLLCYWLASLLLPAGLCPFSDLNKNCWLAQTKGSQMPKHRAFQNEIINLQRTLTKFAPWERLAN